MVFLESAKSKDTLTATGWYPVAAVIADFNFSCRVETHGMLWHASGSMMNTLEIPSKIRQPM